MVTTPQSHSTMTAKWWVRGSRVGLVLVAFVMAVFASQAAAQATVTKATGVTKPVSRTGIANWKEVGSYDESSLDASEGVATVVPAGKTSYLLYRGLTSVPKNLAAEGWGHIGDPDSTRGYIIDAYQGPSSGHSKMFLVTTPAGATAQYVHTLVPRELYNNSFDAIAPGAQWMVAGEWETMSHLQIYPTPDLNLRTSPHGGPLPLAGYIKLDHRVNDIQGCDFTSKTILICASDDDTRTLFSNQKPLLEVLLPHPLEGTTLTAHVIDLGSIPQKSTCPGPFEAEGVDYAVASGILRVEIIQPGSCILHTTVYEYAHAG
jgi:hypothetical protein